LNHIQAHETSKTSEISEHPQRIFIAVFGRACVGRVRNLVITGELDFPEAIFVDL
jgi:hypothetical protein